MPPGIADVNQSFVCLQCVLRYWPPGSRSDLASVARGLRGNSIYCRGARDFFDTSRRDVLRENIGFHEKDLRRTLSTYIVRGQRVRRQPRPMFIQKTALASSAPLRIFGGSPSQHGLFTTSSLSLPNPELPRSESLRSGTARLTDKTLLAICGPDTAHFLQGITTNNITTAQALGQLSTPGSENGQGLSQRQSEQRIASSDYDCFADTLVPHSPARQAFPSAFLNAQGRILHDVFVYPCLHSSLFYSRLPSSERDIFEQGKQQAFLIEVATAEASLLRKHLMRYKLRAKVNLKIVDPAKLGVFVSWGPQPRDQVLEQLRSRYVDANAVIGAMASEDQIVGCRDPRAPGLGIRIVLPLKPPPAASDTLFTQQTSPPEHPDPALQAYTLHRILHGIPASTPPGTALPHEQNMDVTNLIDFRKGCYVGQELTIRTQHSGVVRKRVLPVQLYLSPAGAEPNARVASEPPIPDLDATRETPEYDPTRSPDLAALVPPGADIIPHAVKRGRPAGKWIGGIGNVGLALCRVEMMTDLVVDEAEAAESGLRWRPGKEFRVKGEEGESGARHVCVKAFVPGWVRERVRPRGQHLRV